MIRKLVACVAAGTIAGAAFAKLPPAAPLTDAQKTEKAAKDKAGADKDAELLAKLGMVPMQAEEPMRATAA